MIIHSLLDDTELYAKEISEDEEVEKEESIQEVSIPEDQLAENRLSSARLDVHAIKVPVSIEGEVEYDIQDLKEVPLPNGNVSLVVEKTTSVIETNTAVYSSLNLFFRCTANLFGNIDTTSFNSYILYEGIYFKFTLPTSVKRKLIVDSIVTV